MPQVTQTTALRTLLVIAALVVIVAGLKLAGTLLLPFLVAVFLSIVVTPLVLWIERRGLPPGIAVLITMVGVLGAMLGFGAIVTQSVAGFEEALPGYRQALDGVFTDIVQRLANYGIEVDGALRKESLEPGTVVGMAGSFMSNVIAALSNTALVVLTMVFILLEVAGFPAKLRASLGDPEADLSEFAEIMVDVQRYLALKTVVSIVTGVCVYLMLAALDVDFAGLWGLVAFLLNFIPNIGSIIAAIPAMAIALVQPGLGLWTMVAVGLGYVVVNTILGNIIEPLLMGRRLGLSPLVVFLSLVFWGWVWGPVGMVLSVPLTIAVRIALERSEGLRWVAVLLGPSPEWERPRRVGQSLLRRLGVRGQSASEPPKPLEPEPSSPSEPAQDEPGGPPPSS